MAVIKVKLTDIAYPEHYVRLAVDSARVDYFIQTVADLAPDQDPKKPKLKAWTLPPVKVVKIEPEAGKHLEQEATGKGKKKAIVLKPYELVDGRHRVETATRLGMKEIDAEVVSIKDSGKRFIEQFTLNNEGPLSFNAQSRANAVWIMANIYKIPQKDLVPITKMHKASISRIASKKQGFWEKGKPKKAKKETVTGAPEYIPSQLFDRLVIMTGADGYQKIKTGFLAYAKEQTSGAKVLNLIQNMRAIVDDLMKLVDASLPPAKKIAAPKPIQEQVKTGEIQQALNTNAPKTAK
jgi:hypothetical protein